MPKKLVYLSTSLIPSTQANSVQVIGMCNALSRYGFEVTLLAGMALRYRNISISEYYGIDNSFTIIRKLTGCHRGSTFLLSMRYYPMIKSLAAKAKDALFYGRDVLGLYFLAGAGRSVIYETHDMFEKGPRSWAERKLITSQNLHKIVFISEELKKAYIKKYDILLSNEQMIVAPDAADEQPNPSDKVILKSQSEFNACYIGNLHRGRGIELILEVAVKMPDVGFHLFGGTKKQVLQLKQKNPCNVHFYDHITPAETYKARNAADVLLMPYQKKVMVAHNSSETSRWMSPIKLFEYMSARKPIISSNHVVLQEVLENERNCLLCEPNNVEQWVEAVTRLKADKGLSDRISTTAYEDFANNYTWDRRIERIFADDNVVANG